MRKTYCFLTPSKLVGYGLTVSFFTLFITSIFATQIQLAYAGGKSPYKSGYDHGCDDARLSPSDRYINEPGKGPRFHTDEFMSGYNNSFRDCGGVLGGGGGGGSIEDDFRDACVRILHWSEERCDNLIRIGKGWLICNALRAVGIPC